MPPNYKKVDEKMKTGKIGKEDDTVIVTLLRRNVPISEIARRVRRAEHQVAKYCREVYGKGEDLPPEAEENADFKRELRTRSEWKILQTQFTATELAYYQELYGNFMRQFKEDIEHTEEFQIFSLIEKIIMMNRFKTKEKQIEEELLQIDRELTNILLNEDQDDDAVKRRVATLQNKKLAINSTLKHRIETYTALDKQKDEILKRLGGAREQRIKNIESSKQSWAGLIRLLIQDKKARKAEGRHAALRAIATYKAAEKLKEPHRYINGEIDQPLLTPEDVRIFDSQVSNEIESSNETQNISYFPAESELRSSSDGNRLEEKGGEKEVDN
jgi:hypothetical protein